MSLNGVFLSARILAACAPLLLAGPMVGAADPLATGMIAVSQTVQCCYREGAMSYVYVRQLTSDQPTTRV